jgi:hypothetical protein
MYMILWPTLINVFACYSRNIFGLLMTVDNVCLTNTEPTLYLLT